MASEESHYSDTLPGWEGELYAANLSHHRRYDEDFLRTLPLRITDRVLDVGCGAGDFTATVAALVPDGEVVGLDPQPSMLAQARPRAAANQSFHLLAAQDMGGAALGGPFDVVMSRAVLHWIPWADYPGVLASARQLLVPRGVLRVECGGAGNVREVVAYLDSLAAEFTDVRCPWTFAGAGEWLDLLRSAGFDVEGGFVRSVAQRRGFDRESLAGWMVSQGTQGYELHMSETDAAAFRAAATEGLDALRRDDGSYDLTYVRADVLAFNGTRG